MAQPNRKGATAETEIMAMLQVAVNQVYEWSNSQGLVAYQEPPDLRRKDLLKGWHDISGIPWLAPEVKHHATMSRPQWWRQCVTQAEASGGEPVLFYKVTRKTGLIESGKWHVQTYMMKSPGKGAPMLRCPCIVPIEDWLTYFKDKLLWKLQNEPF